VDKERPGQEDIDQLRRERDALAARVAALDSRRVTWQRVRRVAVAVLLVVGTFAFTLSAVGWWARRNVANTETWLERVGPLADDPAVHAALGAWLSDEVIELVDPSELFVEVLPERGRLLAAPLAGAVEDFVRDRIDRFLASDRFERLWLAANERAHRAAIRVLRGESDVAQAQGDTVVINLVPTINAALANIGATSPELLGREVDLPDLTVDDLPEAAIERLERALGVELDGSFGQFVVYDHGRLGALQEAVDRARRVLVVLSATTVVALGGALWLSDRRRRTILQLLAGLAVGIAVIRRLGLRGQRELLAAIPNEVNRAAAEAASDRFLDPLLAVTQTLLVVLAVIALAVVVTGPYAWAVWLRSRAVDLARNARQAGYARRAAGGSDWVRTNRSGLQVGGVAVVVLVLLVADLSFFGLAALGVLAALGGALLSKVPAELDVRRPGDEE
jgi:hypothetical protein